MELEGTAAAHRRVLERLDHAHVRVLEGRVLANEDDVDVVEEALRVDAHIAPARHELLAVDLLRRRDVDGAEVETLLQEVDKALLAQKEGNVVGRGDVVDTKNLLGRDMAEHGDLLHCGGLEGVLTAASKLTLAVHLETSTHEIGDKTKAAEVASASLGRLSLLLTADDRNERDVDKREVLVANAELELAHGLDEGGRLDVTNCTAELNDADIWLLASLVDGALRDALDPVLDGVGKVGHNLNRLAEVVTATLYVSAWAVAVSLTSRSMTCE